MRRFNYFGKRAQNNGHGLLVNTSIVDLAEEIQKDPCRIMHKISIIVPVYNEQKAIKNFIIGLKEVTQKISI